MATPSYKKTEKVLNNVGTEAYKSAPKPRELSDASMSARKKDEKPGKPVAGTENKIKFKCIFGNGKVQNVCSESSEKIAKYITENADKIVKIERL